MCLAGECIHRLLAPPRQIAVETMPAPGSPDTRHASRRPRNEPERRPPPPPARGENRFADPPYQGGLAMPLWLGGQTFAFSCIRAKTHDTQERCIQSSTPMDAHTQCLGRNVAHMFAPSPTTTSNSLGASLGPVVRARPMGRSNPRRDRLSSRAHLPRHDAHDCACRAWPGGERGSLAWKAKSTVSGTPPC